MKKITSAVAVLALTLALAVPAFGQSSVEGYNDEGGQVASQVQGGGNTPPSADDGSSLPFTGLDVSLLAAAGCRAHGRRSRACAASRGLRAPSPDP